MKPGRPFADRLTAETPSIINTFFEETKIKIEND